MKTEAPKFANIVDHTPREVEDGFQFLTEQLVDLIGPEAGNYYAEHIYRLMKYVGPNSSCFHHEVYIDDDHPEKGTKDELRILLPASMVKISGRVNLSICVWRDGFGLYNASLRPFESKKALQKPPKEMVPPAYNSLILFNGSSSVVLMEPVSPVKTFVASSVILG